ncbi:MAG: hypothetical protein SNJ28_02400 [Rikenellaceae bacterium]
MAVCKTPLIKASEDLEDRLGNFYRNIDQRWHIDNESYYIKSFMYRLLVFWYWIDKAEYSLCNYDYYKVDKNDEIYLNYIKTLKRFFCECRLLSSFGYTGENNDNHFFTNEFPHYSNYVKTHNDVMTYDDFEKKYDCNHAEIQIVVNYIVGIQKDDCNLNYNIIKVFHIFLILFLNKYGLNYQRTSFEKIKALIIGYGDFKIKKEVFDMLKRNKIDIYTRIKLQLLLRNN